ncbi:MAG: hypothetical protein KC466_19115 [Myxococcales bacterium]|nr:hypothetical protein [Myxococcales bacterium]
MKRMAYLFLVVTALAAVAPGAASADPYDKHDAGHPLKFVATLVYPIGWLLDHGVARPLHWLVHRPGFIDVFGHEDFDRVSAFD